MTRLWYTRAAFASVIAVLATAYALDLDDIDSAATYVENLIQLPPDITSLNDGDTFDYIVVGAGAAGCVVATRLALAGAHVLLVEAGGDQPLLSLIPGAAMGLLGSDVDWQYHTIPNNVSCLASEGKQCRFSRGKCLGGSTSINFMMYVRGNQQDFNYNLTGWTYEEFEPFFLRYEGLQDPETLPSSTLPHHNTSGTVKVRHFPDSGNEWHSKLFEAFKSLDFSYNPDVNVGSQIGVSQVLGFTDEGERTSTARAYLTRKDAKKNLHVAKYTRCTGVIVNENNSAEGVTVVRGKNINTLKLFARKEIILSAGVIGTTQLLLLSGIGPEEHLKEMSIPVRSNLPVGKNMFDHISPLMFILVDHGFGLDFAPNPFMLGMTSEQAAEWLLHKTGPLASIGLTDVTGFANTNCYDFHRKHLVNDKPECEIPSVQYIFSFIPRNLIRDFESILVHIVGLNREIIQQVSDANVNSALIITVPLILAPYSFGNVTLANKNPLDDPSIFPNFLSDKRDVDEMVKTIRILEDLVDSDVFKENNASLLHFEFDDCPDYAVDKHEYWRCYSRHLTFPIYHSVGTSALGKVVDERFRVYHVDKLRVADASVLPQLPHGNPSAAVIAVGERASYFIIDDNKQ